MDDGIKSETVNVSCPWIIIGRKLKVGVGYSSGPVGPHIALGCGKLSAFSYVPGPCPCLALIICTCFAEDIRRHVTLFIIWPSCILSGYGVRIIE